MMSSEPPPTFGKPPAVKPDLPSAVSLSKRARPITFTPGVLVRRGLRHYSRLALAVALASAVGVAVLAGSLIVGDSTRASLRDLTLDRLGRIDQALDSDLFFRARLAEAIPGAAPAILLTGSAVQAQRETRAGHVQVLGVDHSFWTLGSSTVHWDAVGEFDAIVNEPLAREIQANPGDDIIVRVPRPSAVQRESVYGDRAEVVATLRARVVRVIPARGLGRFGLNPSQYEPLTIYIPLETLQRRLDRADRINTILAPASRVDPELLLTQNVDLEDVGLRFRQTSDSLILESERIFLSEYDVELAREATPRDVEPPAATLAYLVNALRGGDRSIPYSMVAAIDRDAPPDDQMLLNRWAADDLQAAAGDSIELTYFVEAPGGGLAERSTTLTVAGVLPMAGRGADPSLVPEYPGITDAAAMDDWNPPMPIDLKRVRPVDEQYWDRYRTSPKGLVSLATGRRLWANRHGALTSLRWPASEGAGIREAVRKRLDPARAGLDFRPVKRQGLEAGRGSTDFGGLFVGFSLFLLVSAAMLIQILFRLNVENRASQLGLLRAVGFPPSLIRRLLLTEGALVAGLGALVGLPLGVGYAALMIHGLHAWWLGSIGTPFLRLHVSPSSLLIGLCGGWLTAMLAIVFAVRRLVRLSPRDLLVGRVAEDRPGLGSRSVPLGVGCGLGALSGVLIVAGFGRPAGMQAAQFFSAGAALLVAVLVLFAAWMRRGPGRRSLDEGGRLTLTALGFSGARRRPGRSLVVAGLMASAAFLIVAVGANRRQAQDVEDKRSGAGGFTLMAESDVPLYAPIDPKLLGGARAFAFRLRPGDDASCLNLYQPRRPRLLGAPEEFIRRGGFGFAGSLAADAAERENPWLLLDKPLDDDAIPVIGDYNTVVWLLHKRLGEDLMVDGRRLRIVALLAGSIFQSELLMSEANFTRHFPDVGGWRFFTIDAPPADGDRLARSLESALGDNGFDVTATRERLDELMTVENAYLSTFQALGGLGLLLGTLGLALVLARNLVERRAEFALLKALGWRFGDSLWLAVSENLLLLGVGIVAGGACALASLLPAFLSRSVAPPWGSLALTLLGTFAFGLLAAVIAAWVVLRRLSLRAIKEA